MRIAVVGSGYVGLVAGACFADLGHDVILVDNDQEKLSSLRNGEVPIHEKFLPELLTRHRGNRLTFSDDLKQAVGISSVIFVAVGTPPTESGEADLSYVESVAREISGGVNDARSSSTPTASFRSSEKVRPFPRGGLIARAGISRGWVSGRF